MIIDHFPGRNYWTHRHTVVHGISPGVQMTIKASATVLTLGIFSPSCRDRVSLTRSIDRLHRTLQDDCIQYYVYRVLWNRFPPFSHSTTVASAVVEWALGAKHVFDLGGIDLPHLLR